MEYALTALLGVIIGVVAGWLIGRGAALPRITELQAQLGAEKQKAELAAAQAREADSRAENERQRAERQFASLRAEHAAEMDARHAEHRQALKADSDRWQERFESLKAELGRLQAESLAQKQSALASENSRQINELLEPVRRQFAELGKLTRESHTASEVGRRELQGAFSTAMKLFQQQQQQAVEQMQRQTEKISSDAAALGRALRGDNRAQGRWGEMVLEHILEESGLRRDHEFVLQNSRAGSEGQQQRPDVVVQLPDERAVIIDSKVSLTAYAAAVEAQDSDPAVAEKLLTDHARSVRRHVDELAAKDYTASQPGAVEMVMMFLPTDSSYMAAVRSQPDLIEYALRKRVAIITPSNLMLSLKLVYHLWQHERQERNVEKIVARGNELYSRMAGFMDSFTEIGTMLGRVGKVYETAEKRLTGRGGLVSQFEMLRKLGLTPKKRIRQAEIVEEDAEGDDIPAVLPADSDTTGNILPQSSE